jgi:outer membrane protein OmpA-like peptidoglycan-associated protein
MKTKWSDLTGLAKFLILIVVIGGLAAAVYFLAPGLRVAESKKMEAIEVTKEAVDNKITSAELPLPSTRPSNKVDGIPLTRIAAYAWNCQQGIIVSNGGAFTTRGSLMEQNGVNLEFIRQDWLAELRNLQFKFVQEYDKGIAYPKEGVFGIIIMGDGAPYYISSAQQALNDKYGQDKYHVKVAGCIGISNGEDKLIGPVEWKNNPMLMKGSVISVVIGDGDWVTAVNFASLSGLKVNPDASTWDADAVNFYPSENNDYIKSAEELIKSQKQGWTVEFDEVKNGERTGKKVQKKITGCATWTPGDKMVFDALDGYTDIASTKEFNNQMPTTLIVVDEWARQNPDIVSNIFKSALTAGNQMKQYDSWRVKASQTIASCYQLETPEYWYKMFDGQTATKAGVTYNMGGSRVFNYSDVLQYYGRVDGMNRYKAVYDQVSKYLVDLNPDGFTDNVERVVPYDEAVNLSYLMSVNISDAGVATTVDYSQTATNVVATGNWSVNFNVGSATIKSNSISTLNEVYNLVLQAETSKLELVGHTDDTGSDAVNLPLSKERANAVADYLISEGIPANRFQSITGKGENNPLVDGTSTYARAQNRRVVIILKN